MEYPVDINTVAYWPMDDERNPSSNTAFMAQALATSGVAPDFTANTNSISAIFSEARGIKIGQPPQLVFERTQPFTISAWIFPIEGYHVIYSNANDDFTTPHNERGITFSTKNGIPRLRLINTGFGSTPDPGAIECAGEASGASINIGTERHLLVTYNGNSDRSGITFYVDGVARVTNAGIPITNNLTQTIISPFDIHIGKNPSATPGGTIYYAAAAIRHVSVWNRALTSGEVFTIYNSGTPNDLLSLAFFANLLAWWKIQVSDNFLIPNGVLDSATVGPFHGTAVGTTGIVTGTRGVTIGWEYAATSLAAGSSRMCRIAGGPRQALDLGPDNCRWFNKTNFSATDLSSGISPQSSIGGRHHAHTTQCLFGPVWTIEGWLYIDIPPSITGILESAPTAIAVCGFGDETNLMTVQIGVDDKLQVTWTSGSVRTSTSTLPILVQQWFHFAAIGTVNGANRDVQFYIAGVDAGLVTGKPKAPTADTYNRWLFATSGVSINPQADQFWGGMAYFRFSDKARTLSEIQAAATDPANIIVDTNTISFWGLQESPHAVDKSPNGNHLTQRSVMEGNTPAAPNDVYGAQGPSATKKSHLFANSSSNTAIDSPAKQFVADMFCGQNEYTIECFFNPENNLSANRDLYFAGGSSNHTTNSDNIVLQWTFLTSRKFQILYETEQRLMQADNDTSSTKLATNLKSRFNSHRTNQPRNYHNTIDTINPILSIATTPPTALLNELKADFNNHILNAAFHNVADITNTIISPNATNTATSNTLANELQTKFNLHGINFGGNYHNNLDSETVTTGSGTVSASYKWFIVSSSVAFALSGTQSKELSEWYEFTLKKRNAGNLNYWKLSELAASTHAISMGNAAQYSFERTTAFSIIIWVNSLPTNLGTPRIQHIIGKSDNAANITGYSLFYATDGKLSFLMGNGTGGAGNFIQVASDALLTGIETCLAITYNGSGTVASGVGVSGIKLFGNGVRLTNGTPTGATLNAGTTLTAAPFTIGQRNLTDQPLGGYIREASVWNRELSATEIAEAFGSSGRPPPNLLTSSMVSALIGYWKFDQSDTNLSIIDHSSSGVNGIPQGGLIPTIKPSNFWDIYINGQPLETLGPYPSPTIGAIFDSGKDTGSSVNRYTLSPRNNFGTTVKERRSQMRLSNIARTDAEILEYYDFIARTASTAYKMRAVDDAAAFPGYIYWIASFPDFDATLASTATPPLIGNIVPGSVTQLTKWNT